MERYFKGFGICSRIHDYMKFYDFSDGSNKLPPIQSNTVYGEGVQPIERPTPYDWAKEHYDWAGDSPELTDDVQIRRGVDARPIGTIAMPTKPTWAGPGDGRIAAYLQEPPRT
jgi:hypothetical protein